MTNRDITPNQQKAIIALLAESDIEKAADRIGINKRTLFRWLNDDTFKSALVKAENDLIAAGVRQLVRLQSKAIKVIESFLDDSELPPTVRLRAALGVFGNLVKLRQYAEMEERITKLEETLGELRQSHGK